MQNNTLIILNIKLKYKLHSSSIYVKKTHLTSASTVPDPALDLKYHLFCNTHTQDSIFVKIFNKQPYHPAAQVWLPTEAKQGWAGQYLDGRPPEKTRLLLEEGVSEASRGAHAVVCVGPNAPV